MKKSFVVCFVVFALLGSALMVQAQRPIVDEVVSPVDGDRDAIIPPDRPDVERPPADEGEVIMPAPPVTPPIHDDMDTTIGIDPVIIGPGGENPVAVAKLRAMTLEEYASDIAQNVVERIEWINKRNKDVPPPRSGVFGAREEIAPAPGSDTVIIAPEPDGSMIEPFPLPAPPQLEVPSVEQVKEFVYRLTASFSNVTPDDIDFTTVTVGEYCDGVAEHILERIAGLNDFEKRILGIWILNVDAEAELQIMANRVANFIASYTDCEFTRPIVDTASEETDVRPDPAPRPAARARGGMFFCPALQKGS